MLIAISVIEFGATYFKGEFLRELGVDFEEPDN